MLCAFTAKADVFTVTSNADSGPGTLREALLRAAANGVAVKDFINFNLPGNTVDDRTIDLLSMLPAVSSNLVIDGTTQPGLKLGESNASVKIRSPKINDPFTIFTLTNVNDVELYGLYLYDFTYINTIWADVKEKVGIELLNCKNITIGGGNRGNIVKGFNSWSVSAKNVDGFIFKGNVIGLNENNNFDHDGYLTGVLTAHIRLLDCNNIKLGGDLPTEGNIFFCIVSAELSDKTTIHNIEVKGNNFGVFKDGVTTTIFYSENYGMEIITTGVNVYGASPAELDKAVTVNLNIKNNAFGNFDRAFFINALKGNVNFTNNYVGLGRDGATSTNIYNSRPNEGVAFGIANSLAQVNVGGNDPLSKNYFYDQSDALSVENSPNILFRNNEFRCLVFPAYGLDHPELLPQVSIKNVNYTPAGTTLTGVAPANALIDVYSTEGCTYANCSVRQLILTTTADNTGSWQAVLNGLNGTFYVSATVNNRTSVLKTFEINNQNVLLENMRCTSQAKITGLQVPPGLTYYWADEQGNVVSPDLDLVTTKPGKYRLVLGNGCVTSQWYEIKDEQLSVYEGAKTVTDASCNNGGSIKGLFINDPRFLINSYTWTKDNGIVVSHTIDAENLAAGNYSLKITTSDGCEKTYGPITLTNAAAPVIVENSYTTTPSNCNSPTGAINGIYATGGTGTLKYSWRNAQDQEVSTSANPTNQYAGKYRLRVTDDSNCGAVYSTEIEILESNGVSLDLSGQGGVSPSCNRTNGSITGLQAPGATSFEWVITGTTTNVGHNLNLTGVPAGFYTLTISNTTCSRSYDFEVAGFPPTAFTGITYTKTKSCDAFPTGTISLNTDNANEQPLQYLWLDEQGNPAGYAKEVGLLKAGKYKLQLIDKNYCTFDYPEVFTIEAYPEFKVLSFGTVTNTQCGVGTGGVSATTVSGGTGTYTFQWLDADNNDTPIPGKDQASITDLFAGHYKLRITDGGCNLAEPPYTIIDQAVTPPAPSVENVRVYNAGNATIKINSPFPTAIYRLYETATSPQPIKDTIGGNITINVTQSRSYYVSLTYGYCESGRTEVKVFLSALTGGIVNTFTPNGDGVNDYWVIKGLDTYPDATVSIFNRYGQSVFQSTGYAKPFDGNRNGKPLPVGVYYYIINLKRGDVLSGNVTILR